MTSTVIKGKIVRSDLAVYDGVEARVSRRDSTGGNILSPPLNDFVDVLQAYGEGNSFTGNTIEQATVKIGSRNRTLRFSPGTWEIESSLTIASNFTCYIPAGCVFNVASGKTLTFSGPIIRESETWTSGSGTVTYTASNNTLTHSVDLADTTLAARGDGLIGGKRTESGTSAFTLHTYNQNRYFSAKTDFGAVGDGSTDDTTALTNAINTCNTADTSRFPATLFLEPGFYKVTPGSLPTINHNVYGPAAAIISSSTADTNLLTFDDLAQGRFIDLYGIFGVNFEGTWQTAANQHSIGLQVLRAEHSRFTFQKMEGLFAAIDFAGQVNENHIGECKVKVHSILHNNFGINLNAGDAQCEANRFEIDYFNNNTTNVLLRNHGSAGNSLCANNHFDILVIEYPSVGGIGFDLGGDVPAQTLANTFIVRENINPNGTATVIKDNGSATLGCNYFRFSNFDFAKINTSSKQIYDGLAEHNEPGTTNFHARSMTFGAAAYSGASAYHQLGSLRYNNAPVAGGNVGWVNTAAGNPGTIANFGIIDGATVTETAATHTLADTTKALIANRAGTITVTLPAASVTPGREIYMRTIQAQTVVSASSNIIPLTGGAAGTAILPATAGAFALLKSDATNWQIMYS